MTVEIDRNFHDHATDRKRLDFYTAENTVPASSGITGGDFQDTDLSADARIIAWLRGRRNLIRQQAHHAGECMA